MDNNFLLTKMTVPGKQTPAWEKRSDTRTLITTTVFKAATKWLPISEYSEEYPQGLPPGDEDLLQSKTGPGDRS